LLVVDSHLHVWRAAEGDSGSLRTIVPPQADVPIELARETMAEHEVERAVLVQPVFRGEDNSYVAECARREPRKFAAVCYVDPRRPEAATRLAHWVGQGCRGLRMRPRLPDEASCFGDPATYPLWQAAADANVVVSLLASVEHAPAIAKLAERFGECAIVVDHLGHPNTSPNTCVAEFRPILDLARHKRIHLKLSGFHHFSRARFPYHDCQGLVRAAYDHFGSERLLWGSDFPHVLLASSYARCRLLVAEMLGELSAQERHAVLGGNALALYWPGV
jgi:L-fuconolactonase